VYSGYRTSLNSCLKTLFRPWFLSINPSCASITTYWLPEMPTYHGNCHCGRYRFDLTVPDIKNAISCACSLCAKKGSLWLVPPADSFHIVRDDGRLIEYQSTTLKDKVRHVDWKRSRRNTYLLALVLQLLWHTSGGRTSVWPSRRPVCC